jgi:hypothetical protein
MAPGQGPEEGTIHADRGFSKRIGRRREDADNPLKPGSSEDFSFRLRPP